MRRPSCEAALHLDGISPAAAAARCCLITTATSQKSHNPYAGSPWNRLEIVFIIQKLLKKGAEHCLLISHTHTCMHKCVDAYTHTAPNMIAAVQLSTLLQRAAHSSSVLLELPFGRPPLDSRHVQQEKKAINILLFGAWM